MPFIPHTDDDIRSMLDTIGADSIEDLFDEIPRELRGDHIDSVPEGMTEMAISRLMNERAARDAGALCFIGAGAYEHHVPAAVWEITTRGEYYSAYTPYQAEASQGTLQLIYEYQTMMAGLTGMDVANASLYDGASAMAEAALMAVRASRKTKSARILVPATVHPAYLKTARAICGNQDVRFEELPYDRKTGTTNMNALRQYDGPNVTAVVIPQPNFFGKLEDVDAITDWAHEQGALVIAVVNPLALALIRPPGEWGEQGADIVCGEGQPLGAPLSSGGPYFGLMCCRQKLARQMPGRIVGRTRDLEGREGYTLTLQPREQHIRRSKATSNICTNQGLLVTAATIHMSLLGPEGLQRAAGACVANTRGLVERLTALPDVEEAFTAPGFHEAVLRVDQPVNKVLEALTARGILGGYALGRDFPELSDCLLVCVTETKTETDLDAYANALADILQSYSKKSAVA